MGLTDEAWNRALFPDGEEGEEGKVKSFLDRAKDGDDAEGESGGIMALALRGERGGRGGGMSDAWQLALAGHQTDDEVAHKAAEDDPKEEHPRQRSLLQRTVGSGLQGFAHGMGLPTDTEGAFNGLGNLLGGATMAVLIDDTKAAVERETALHKVRAEEAGNLERARLQREQQRILRDAEKVSRNRIHLQEKEKKKKEKANQPPSATKVAFTQFGDTLRDHADGLGRDIMAGISGLTARGLDAARRTARSWRKGGADSTEPVAGVDVISSDGQKIA